MFYNNQATNPQYKTQSSPKSNQTNQHDFSDFFESVFNQSQASSRKDNIYREHPGFKGQDIEMALSISLEEALLGGSKTISFQLPSDKNIKKLKIKIPAKTQAGDLIRLKGQGLPGSKNRQPGDIYLRVNYESHAYFDVVGLDLILTVPITPWEAALGAKIIIPTLTSKLNLTIPANTQTGKKMRIKNKGLKKQNKKWRYFCNFPKLLCQIKMVPK